MSQRKRKGSPFQDDCKRANAKNPTPQPVRPDYLPAREIARYLRSFGEAYSQSEPAGQLAIEVIASLTSKATSISELLQIQQALGIAQASFRRFVSDPSTATQTTPGAWIV